MNGDWYLKVYDNFHYQDEGETYTRGPYPSASHAISAAREIVDASLRKEKGHSQSAEQLLTRYKSFGEDPMVIGPGDFEFSAWTYAQARASQVFAEAPSDDHVD